MNEIVKYDNYMNTLHFKDFGITDFNFLIVLCAKLKDKDVNRVTLNFCDLRTLTGYKQTSNEQFIKDLVRMNEKLQKITARIETDQEIISFVLFPTFLVNKQDQTLTICVNEYFKFILNDVVQNFTTFELFEFISLSSKYSKTLYRLLKQWRTQGAYTFHNIADFKEKMDCPEAYTNKKFIEKIIKPSVQEISSLDKSFQNFNYECIYDIHKRGKPLIGLKFMWKAEKIKEMTDNDININNKPYISKNKSKKFNNFNNIPQRQYDFIDLERQLQTFHDNHT